MESLNIWINWILLKYQRESRPPFWYIGYKYRTTAPAHAIIGAGSLFFHVRAQNVVPSSFRPRPGRIPPRHRYSLQLQHSIDSIRAAASKRTPRKVLHQFSATSLTALKQVLEFGVLQALQVWGWVVVTALRNGRITCLVASEGASRESWPAATRHRLPLTYRSAIESDKQTRATRTKQGPIAEGRLTAKWTERTPEIFLLCTFLRCVQLCGCLQFLSTYYNLISIVNYRLLIGIISHFATQI